MEKPHMGQLNFYKWQVGYPKRKLLFFLHSKDSYTKYRHATRRSSKDLKTTFKPYVKVSKTVSVNTIFGDN